METMVKKLPYVLLDKEFKNKSGVRQFFKKILEEDLITNKSENFKYIVALYEYSFDKEFNEKLGKVINFKVRISKKRGYRYFVGILEGKKKPETLYFPYSDCLNNFYENEDKIKLGRWRDYQIDQILKD